MNDQIWIDGPEDYREDAEAYVRSARTLLVDRLRVPAHFNHGGPEIADAARDLRAAAACLLVAQGRAHDEVDGLAEIENYLAGLDHLDDDPRSAGNVTAQAALDALGDWDSIDNDGRCCSAILRAIQILDATVGY